ncbi:MAG: TonB-dependent receptor [Bacteroidetes bacterium]|nr:TonB-dependent receptor [Bacteroidota bacterium]
MKRKLFFLFFLIHVCLIFSQTVLTGTIKNKDTHDPLPGAVIYFPDLKSGVASGEAGTFTITNLPKIQTLVQIKLIGFKTYVKQVDLTGNPRLDVELEESVIEEEEIVVTGTSHATEMKHSPVPMVSIDQKYLTQNSSSNIIDALIKVPGISAVTTGPNISKPYIRGLGYNRVLTLFDGVRQDGQQWGDEHGIEVDQFLIDRVEVIKGPASLIYGSDALAGVINLLSANPLPEGTVKGSLLSNYQTNNNQAAGSLNMAGNQKGFNWAVRASKKQAGNYTNKYDGKVYGTKYNESDLNINIGLNKSWGYSHVNFSYYDNVQEVPDGYRDSATRKFVKHISEEDTLRPIVSTHELNSYDITGIHQRVQYVRAFSSSNFFVGKSKLAVNVGFQQSIRREFSHPQFLNLAGLYLKLNTVTYDFKFYFPELKKTQLVLGVNGMLQQNKNGRATEFVIPNYQSFDVGPFAFVKRSFGKLDLAGGVRYDTRSFSNASLYTVIDPLTGFQKQSDNKTNDTTLSKQFSEYNHTFSGISGSFGATFNVSDKLSVKCNVGRGYRAPNISEISAKGIHPGTGFLQLGDGNFKPEFSLQEDVGVFFESEHISGSVELFNNIISNYIYNEKLISYSGSDSVYLQSGNNYPVFKFRQTTAQLYGGEFSFDIHPHPLDWLHIENSISLIYAANLGGNGSHITDSTRYLPYIPPFHTNSELRADFKKQIACFSEIFVKVGLQYYAEQNRIFSAYGTETKTPSYTLLDAGFGTTVLNKKGKHIFTVIINATNLTDVAYQNNMSRLKYFDNYPVNGTGRRGIYSMGRNISFKIIIPLILMNKKGGD